MGLPTSISLDYLHCMIFLCSKKVSENHWCEEIKKTCDVKIYVINSVPPDDEIQIFLDQNILDLFLFSPEFEIFFKRLNLIMYLSSK